MFFWLIGVEMPRLFQSFHLSGSQLTSVAGCQDIFVIVKQDPETLIEKWKENCR